MFAPAIEISRQRNIFKRHLQNEHYCLFPKINEENPFSRGILCTDLNAKGSKDIAQTAFVQRKLQAVWP